MQMRGLDASNHVAFDGSVLHNIKTLMRPLSVVLPSGRKVQATEFDEL